MDFKLKTQELVELNKRVYVFNKHYGMILHSLGNFTNVSAAKKIIEVAKELKKELESVKTEDEFEKLFVENHILNIENQRAYLEYFSMRTAENIEDLTKMLLGEKTIEILKENIKNFNYEKHWEFYLSYQEYSYKSIPSDDVTIQNEFKKILDQLKRDLLAYGEEHFNLPKNYDFDLVLGQPYSNSSSFNPTTKRMEISPGTFFVFKEGNEIKINTSYVIEVLFHELLGHGFQEFNSQKLPESLRDDAINTSVPSISLHAEGLAQLTKKHSLLFMEMYKEKYKIHEDYIKQRILSEINFETGNFWSYFQYLKLKNLEDKNFNAEEEFKKVSNNFGLTLIYSESNEKPFSFIKNASYPLGLKYMQDILRDIEKEFGKDFMKKNEADINKALSTGLWNIRVLPKFVKYYLKSLN